MPGTLTRIAFALFAAAFLLPLTAVLGFKLLLLPMAFPTGWPDELSRQGMAVLYLLVFLGTVASAAVAWMLAIGWLRRGRDWFATQSRWLKLAALFAPASVLASAVRYYFTMVQLRATTDPTLMPEVYWENMQRLSWVMIAWSLTFLPPALMAAWPRREARA
jgi:hypothetical protein